MESWNFHSMQWTVWPIILYQNLQQKQLFLFLLVCFDFVHSFLSLTFSIHLFLDPLSLSYIIQRERERKRGRHLIHSPPLSSFPFQASNKWCWNDQSWQATLTILFSPSSSSPILIDTFSLQHSFFFFFLSLPFFLILSLTFSLCFVIRIKLIIQKNECIFLTIRFSLPLFLSPFLSLTHSLSLSLRITLSLSLSHYISLQLFSLTLWLKHKCSLVPMISKLRGKFQGQKKRINCLIFLRIQNHVFVFTHSRIHEYVFSYTWFTSYLYVTSFADIFSPYSATLSFSDSLFSSFFFLSFSFFLSLPFSCWKRRREIISLRDRGNTF